MSCVDETECFTITWEIVNFRKYWSPKDMQIIRSSVWKTETNEGSRRWRFLVITSPLVLDFALVSLNGELKEKDYRFEMSLLTSSGEVQLSNEISDYTCCYHIEKSTIFDENSSSFIPQGTMTLCCRIWHQKLKPGRCLLRSVLHEVNFPWTIEGFGPDSDSIKRSLHQQETTLLSMFLYKHSTQKSTHKVRVELLPDSGRWSSFISCYISINDGCGHVVSRQYIYPKVSCEWDIKTYPEKCKDNNLLLEFEFLISEDVEPQQLPIPSDAYPGSSNTLGDDLLLLYKKSTFSDVTLNTECKSFEAHKNILATRSEVFQAMFEKDQMVEGRSGVVNIKDVNSETMDRLLVFLYSDSLEDLQWEEASALYYAADKYAVLPLKQKCAEILMGGLAAENVCDALFLADKHSDEQLMLCAVDFIRNHEEVISSSAWENLEESHSRLTTKVLRQVILKKVIK